MVKNGRRLIVSLIVVFGILLAPNLNAAANNSTIQYTIKKDDTFYLLSKRFNSSVKNISSMNPKVNPLNLRIGSKIKLPVGPGVRIHHVIKGDTLWKIAKAYNSTVYTIAEKNYIVNPNLIYRGDFLAITKPQYPTKDPISKNLINAIVNELNQSELNKYSTLNARYENGWIKMDNINFNVYLYDQAMSIVKRILDNHNVKIIDYTVENVQYENPMATNHWGTVCIKIGKKIAGEDFSVRPADEKFQNVAREINNLLKANNAGSVRSFSYWNGGSCATCENVNINFDPVTTKDTERFLAAGGDKKIFAIVNKRLKTAHPNTHWGAETTDWGGTPKFSTSWLSIYAVQD